MTFEELREKVLAYNPHVDQDLLEKAYRFAEAVHRHQKRFSGEPYIVHPLAVAGILADLGLDLETIVGGLLHDVVEDGGVELAEIERTFGGEIALLVDGTTKLSRFQYKSKEEHQAENLRKMFLAMAKDIRVILIKLADRLHNLRTLVYHNAAKRKEIAQETLDIFAPLAHRLGIYRLKWELEDLAFRHSNPDEYYRVADGLARTRKSRESYIAGVVATLKEKLAQAGLNADVQGRAKHLYSIYVKMLTQQKDLAEIYDVMGVRIIVETVKDCYAALGAIHALWKPVPSRFKDYIAVPKSNMYQSLHTTVVGPGGELLEIQIRTREMHRTAEYGIAAHWRYKEGRKGDREFDEKLAWLRQLLEWQHELRDAREFMEGLKIDLFADVVFVFTPRGDVIELPAGSIPLDFAYRIHTDVGHRCTGARVNGRLVPLDHRLSNGDVVEIITGKQPNPSRDWLSLVKTSQAKSKIRQWFKKAQREENLTRGRELLEKEARKHGLDLELLRGERMLETARRFSFATIEDAYAAVGQGVITAPAVVARLREEPKPVELPTETYEIRPEAKRWPKTTAGIRVCGVGNLLVRLAHCCNPVPGDPIIGYITRGRGISVHRRDCHNVGAWTRQERERLVEVAWDNDFDAPFQVKLEVSGMDRAGLLADVMEVLSEMKISASWVTARGRKGQLATIDIVLTLKNLEQLTYLVQKIGRIRDVFEVRRVV
ncbi:MAG: RelA/SpoT family protein [Desulfotomaculales bacterium]